jgi:uroporphyrinogen decarboxylase
MNSRERVLAALNHQKADRVPICFSGHRSSGIAAIAYARLRDYLGLPKRPIRVYDPVQQLAIVDPDVLDLFGVDTIELGRAFALEDKWWADWVLPDGTPCQMPIWALPERQPGRWVLRSASGRIIAQMPDGALYFEQTYWPWLDQTPDFDNLPAAFAESMWTNVASPPGPITAGPDGDRILVEGARRLRASTDRAIIGLFGGNLLEIGQFLFRNDEFFVLLANEPERAAEFLAKLTAHHLANLEHYLGLVGPYIDVILFGDDLGMQTGPQISPRMYRRLFKPHHAAMWKRAKELANVKVMLHSCGGLRELLPDLIDAGLDTTNPVQITCKGMEADGLKRDFGARITFWGGGCDTRAVLPHGTPDEVKAHVREQIRILSPGGGFVFQQVHNIMADVPPANIVAMFEAVHEAGTTG